MGLPYEGYLWQFFDKIRRGTGAIVIQNYTEANVKNGLQFYMRQEWTNVAVAASVNLTFTTGAKPAIIKSRELTFNGSSKVLYLAHEGTAATGGSAVTVGNENRISPVATTVSVAHTVTAGSLPAPFRIKAVYGSGSTQAGGSRIGTDIFGRETVLKPNTQYLVIIQNVAGSAADIQFELTWYEGDPDLPVA